MGRIGRASPRAEQPPNSLSEATKGTGAGVAASASALREQPQPQGTCVRSAFDTWTRLAIGALRG